MDIDIDKLWEAYSETPFIDYFDKKVNFMTKENFTKAIAEIINSPVEPVVMQNYTGTWQLCPKCNGQGIVSKPPYVAGDQQTWSSSSAVHTCDVCNGMKIIKR